MTRLLVVTLTLLAAVPALADKPSTRIDCDLRADKDDVVLKGKDVVIEAGRKVKDAVAVDGNVVLRKGARVKNAIALKGKVTVEAGAVVEDSVVALGGKAEVDPGAKVGKSQVWIHEGLHVIDEKGGRVDLDLSVNGSSLAKLILDAVLKDIRDCQVRQE